MYIVHGEQYNNNNWLLAHKQDKHMEEQLLYTYTSLYASNTQSANGEFMSKEFREIIEKGSVLRIC